MAKSVYKKNDEGQLENIGILISQAEFNNKRNNGASAIPNGSNLDSYQNEGWWYTGSGNNCSNRPSGVDAFGLLVIRTASGWRAQILIASNNSTNNVYVRTYTGEAWQAWRRLQFDDEEKDTYLEYETISL